MKKYLHIISHSHWDREWYLGFEQHRARLVELIDALIETMEADPEFQYFHLDGHTIVLEDYLTVRPEMKERLDKLIHDGRIQVGPWYVLQDEFLTSGEANVRNMMEGLRYCAEQGYEPVKTGYFPDAFGNISQAPQLLRGFGIDNAVFGRGVRVILEDNHPEPPTGKPVKELNWCSPDGSKVMGVMFTDWYNNANELPTEPKEVKKCYEELINKLSNSAGTPHLLAMNGCDHQPLQRDLVDSLTEARRQIADQTVILHSNFKDYIDCLRPYADQFPEVYGELTGQKTNGAVQLVDTASTHIPLKLSNHKVQNILQQQSEPISVMASLGGEPYRKNLLRHAWKTLMQNHPHDSICTCSCDAVAKEMSVRFDKAYQTAEYVRDEAAAYLARNINTANGAAQNIIVFHTSPKCTEDEVSVTVHLDDYVEAKDLHIEDINGKIVESQICYLGNQFTYTLPKNAFRKVKYMHTYQVRFPAALEGIGYDLYKLVEGKAAPTAPGITVLEHGAENAFLRFEIQPDGTLTVWDKVSGHCYHGLNRMEDSGDCGDGYNYVQTEDRQFIYADEPASWKLTEQTSYSVTYEVTVRLDIPAGLAGPRQRSNSTVPHEICSRITLRADSRRIEIATTIDNQSENHRLRVLFPNEIQTDRVMADSQFDVVKRDVTPWEGWENPSNTQRMQAFFGLEDDQAGLLIAGRGLHSYEILRDGKNTMAMTLLRGVGQMGDWGYFPTPQMQVKGKITLHYAIIPYAAELKAHAFDAAYSFSNDCLYAVQTDCHSGKLEPNQSLLKVRGDYIATSAWKQAEDTQGVILRLYNVSDFAQEMTVTMAPHLFSNVFETNLAETERQTIALTEGVFRQDVAPKKIKTYYLE